MATELLEVAPEHRLESTADVFEQAPRPQAEPPKLPQGPLQIVHGFRLGGMSCDGCSIAVVGATNPSVESLLAGAVPMMPKVLLHHPVLSVEAGHEFVRNFELAWQGKLADPYVVVYEGSIADERIAARTGGYWAALGVETVDGQNRPGPTAQWPNRLAPRAHAVPA